MKYSKIPLQGFSIWKKVNRDLSSYSKMIYMYLFSSSLTSMSGIFELPDLRKTGLSNSEIEAGLLELSNRNLIVLDNDNELVGIYEMIKINKPAGEKQEKGIIKNYNDIEDFNQWDKILNYMVSIDYNKVIIDFISLSKINKSKSTIFIQETIGKPVSELTQKEKDEEIERVEERLNKKRGEELADVSSGEEELKRLDEDIQTRMKDSKEILDFYIEHSQKVSNDTIERESLESIYEILGKASKISVKNAIERYMNTISDKIYTQGIVKFFSGKEGYLRGFLKDTSKGLTKVKNTVQGSYSNSTKVVEKVYDVPEDIMAINSIAIKQVYVSNLESEYKNFIKERSAIEITDENFIELMNDRLMSFDALAIKFLRVKGISL